MKIAPLYLPALALSLCLSSAPRAGAHEASVAMAEAASAWLSSLDESQKATATREMGDPDRMDWHFIPKPFEGEGMRKGLPIRDMRPDQRALAFALLSSGLSHRGFAQAAQIMSLEQVLWELENESPRRNPEMYYVTVFGEPGAKAWAWSLEGHHMSVNFTIAGDQVASGTPVFFASNPAEVLAGPRKGLKVLAGEEDVARALVISLDAGQRERAVIAGQAPDDILTAALPEVESLGEDGIPAPALNESQQAMLRELIGIYAHRLRPEIAERELSQIEEAGFDKIVFAWAGGFEEKTPHYYRVQGPTFLLEYANVQGGGNHVHAVWRDFKNDFGRDLLREHLAAFPH